MFDLSQFSDAPVAVFGLGRSGFAAARALLDSNVDVWAWDDSAETRDRAEAAGLPMKDLYDCCWEQVNTLVLSPGIPHTHPEPHPIARLARDSGCAIVGDTELLFRAAPRASYLGVTGTNGKSTTTALIGHIMHEAGMPARVGGNIGEPVMAFEPLSNDGFYVLEMSSYQLELTPSAAFDIAILLNISADHLERHGGMDGYIKAKENIFAAQPSSGTAIIGIDDRHAEKIYDSLCDQGKQKVVPISGVTRVAGGVYVLGGKLYDDTGGEAREVLDLNGIATLPGVHNWQNTAAAFAAAQAAGIGRDQIVGGIRSYPGLAHRQELIALIDGVAYVNDSKATNVESAARALACYDMICWIAGGQSKETSLASLKPYGDRIRRAFFIGEAAESFAAELGNHIPAEKAGTLDIAVAKAHACALEAGGDGPVVVLLSPACASFDQFKNFEERGEAFRRLVADLPGRRDDVSGFADATQGKH